MSIPWLCQEVPFDDHATRIMKRRLQTWTRKSFGNALMFLHWDGKRPALLLRIRLSKKCPGWLATIVSWNFTCCYFRVFIWTNRRAWLCYVQEVSASWPNIGQVTCEVASDDVFDAHTSALQEEMVKFCKAALEGSHQRETARNSWNSAWSHRGGEKEQGFPFGHQEHSIMHVGWRMQSMALTYFFSSSSSPNYQRKAQCKGPGTICEHRLCFVLGWSFYALRAPLNDLLVP